MAKETLRTNFSKGILDLGKQLLHDFWKKYENREFVIPYMLGIASGLIMFKGFAFGLIIGLVAGLLGGWWLGVNWKEVEDKKVRVVKKNKKIANRVVSWSGWGVGDR